MQYIHKVVLSANNLIKMLCKYRALAFMYIIAQLLVGIILGECYLLYNNTLYASGNWQSTKMSLHKGVLGAFNFYFDTQALHKKRLNLGSWHGFQELFLNNHKTIKAVACDFTLEPNAYIVFLFKEDKTGRTGFRFSSNKIYNNAMITESDTGEFITKSKLDCPQLYPKKLHHVTFKFDDNSLDVELDGSIVKHINNIDSALLKFGLRGSLANSYVNYVKITYDDGTAYKDSFDNSNNRLKVLTASCLLMILTNFLLCVVFMAIFNLNDKNVLFSSLSVCLFLIVVGVLLYAFLYRYSKFYQPVNKQAIAAENVFQESISNEKLNHLKSSYEAAHSKDVHRILFIGSSQTWGAGARVEKETFVNRFEEILNRSSVDAKHYECFNSGFNGADTTLMLDMYKSELLQFHPNTVVINASSNDIDKELFAQNLRDIVMLGKANGIRTIFILEPNSIEAPNSDLDEKHEIMSNIGKLYGVKVIDMTYFLNKKYDDGHLWWDFVHLTSYGQKIFAQTLFQELEHTLPIRSNSN